MPAVLPSPNESIYIVDEKMHLLSPGLPGEILIGGVGLALGYINNDARTELAFASNKHAHDEYIKNGWTRAYRTGDRGRIEGIS
ncbi:Polyketide synthase-nonribosomal peptide synthetase [Talaromyces pinophilus]|nr:Polyketide synthase-nonribosomal peptide synthetase [Talaromyces pinophilus]